MFYIDNIEQVPASFLAIDIEGNGYWDDKQDIVELAIIEVKNGVISTPVVYMFRPSVKINPIAKKIHGISNKDVENSDSIDLHASRIKTLIDNKAVLFHNAANDIKLLEKKVQADFSLVIDTMKLAKRYLPTLKSFKLSDIISHLDLNEELNTKAIEHNLNNRNRMHSASFDALATIIALNAIRNKATIQGSLFDNFDYK